jgi:hypothetical protein
MTGDTTPNNPPGSPATLTSPATPTSAAGELPHGISYQGMTAPAFNFVINLPILYGCRLFNVVFSLFVLCCTGLVIPLEQVDIDYSYMMKEREHVSETIGLFPQTLFGQYVYC